MDILCSLKIKVVLTQTPHEILFFLTPQNKPQTPPVLSFWREALTSTINLLQNGYMDARLYYSTDKL